MDERCCVSHGGNRRGDRRWRRNYNGDDVLTRGRNGAGGAAIGTEERRRIWCWCDGGAWIDDGEERRLMNGGARNGADQVEEIEGAAAMMEMESSSETEVTMVMEEIEAEDGSSGRSGSGGGGGIEVEEMRQS